MPEVLHRPIKNLRVQTTNLQYPISKNLFVALNAISKTSTPVNTLPEAPVAEKIYNWAGRQYGRPRFRFVQRGGGAGMPATDAFWFSKEQDGKLHLNLILEACRPEENVIPLQFQDLKLRFKYLAEQGQEKELTLDISETLPMNQLNVLKNIHAHTLVPEEDKEAIYRCLTDTAKEASLLIEAVIPWQQGDSNASNGQPDRPPVTLTPGRLAENCVNFDPAKLRVQGAVLYHNNQPFITFRNPADAQKGLATIRHYKMTSRCTVGAKPYLSYFLSSGNAPAGSLAGEDGIGFNPDKIEVKQVGGRWKIVEGNHFLFDFEGDKASADQAFRIIKKWGFDHTCYVGRPNPPMIYLKRAQNTRKAVINTFAGINMLATTAIMNRAVQNPQVRDHRVIPISRAGAVAGNQQLRDHRTRTVVPLARFSAVNGVQKVDFSEKIILNFTKEDHAVFQGFFDELESINYVWEHQHKIDTQNSSQKHTVYYRLTNDPETVFFLPQVFRIAVEEETGEPKVYIMMYADKQEGASTAYRIHVTVQLIPYFHPKAKKDLLEYLFEKSGGKIKYINNLVLGGYKGASFMVNAGFQDINAKLSGTVTEALDQINPAEGFPLSFDCSLEAFGNLNDRILKGFEVGQIMFELEEETSEGQRIIKSQPIPVELNLKKLENIPLAVSLMAVNGPAGNAPVGFYLENKTAVPLKAEGVELTLLSQVNNFVYDIDYQLSTDRSWPVQIGAHNREVILLNQHEMNGTVEENPAWTNLICEPYGVRAELDPEQIMSRVIDRATGDQQLWTLQLRCPVFESWSSMTEEEQLPYKRISGLLVEVKAADEPPLSLLLDKNTPGGVLQMARTVSQLLRAGERENKTYSYRLKTIFATSQQAWSEWMSSDDMGTDHLIVYPIL